MYMLADSSTCKIVRRRKMEVDEQGIMNGSDQRNNCKFPVKWEPKIQNSNSKIFSFICWKLQLKGRRLGQVQHHDYGLVDTYACDHTCVHTLSVLSNTHTHTARRCNNNCQKKRRQKNTTTVMIIITKRRFTCSVILAM